VPHPCYKCHAPVEEGSRFCASCGAAQIRVTKEAESQPEPPSAFDSPSTPETLPTWHSRATEPAFDSAQAWRSALLAGGIAGLLTFFFVPLVWFWCLAAGIFAGMTYGSRTKLPTATVAMGMKLGLRAALPPFGVIAVMCAITMAVPTLRQVFRNALDNALKQAAAQNGAYGEQVAQWVASPSGLATMFALALVFAFLVCAGSGAVGGALWAAFGSRRQSPRE
jgi:hypothetical protein